MHHFAATHIILEIITANSYELGVNSMIEVTSLDDRKLIINAELIERVEETPNTVITLTSGKKLIVKESKMEIKKLVILYKKEIFCREL